MTTQGGHTKWKPGQSGNPAGKKPGTRNRKTLLMEELERDGSALAAAIKSKALEEGDSTCMSLWLSRLEPPARARGETVEFAFDVTKPLSDQIAAITQAAADGELTLEQAQQFAELAKALATVRAMEGGGEDDKTARMVNAMKEFAQELGKSGRA